MGDKAFDVIVIGGGPGGYVAALRAAQNGLTVGLVESRETLGGTCLNIGCVPSKALLDTSEFYSRLGTEAAEHGISTADVSIDLSTMHARKQTVVDRLTAGVATLVKKRKISRFTGVGRIESGRTGDAPARIIVDGPDGTNTLDAGAVVLATGSVPVELPFLPFDGTTVVSSTEALEFDSVPRNLVVVGAGAIGLELGSVWARLGSHVTVVEIMDSILPGWDAQVSKTLARELKKQGLSLMPGHKVTGISGTRGAKAGTAQLTVETPKGEVIQLPADRVLVAVGRRPYYDGAGVAELGITTEERSGRIVVDKKLRTSVDGVYAIGDLVAGPMLAHKAEDEGVAVADEIAGQYAHVNYNAIPGVVYTWPEAAMVGRTEEELAASGVKFKGGTFNFAANARALAMSSGAGFVKVLADAETDEVLGVHVVGPWASDLIAEAVAVIEFGGSAEDVARMCHAHPTLSEAVREAAMAVDGRSIHSL